MSSQQATLADARDDRPSGPARTADHPERVRWMDYHEHRRIQRERAAEEARQ